MKTNILILCLNNKYAKQISKDIANMFDLFYLDINDILEYNLINKKMIDSAGKEYFDKELTKAIKSISQYENTLLCGKFETLSQGENLQILKSNSVVIYLNLHKTNLERYIKSKRNEISHTLIAFDEEDQFCKDNADIVVNLSNDENDNLHMIKTQILNYYGE